jgi:hypothetical protein
MQKLLLLFLFGMAFSMSSCSSDDEDIAGTYKIIEFSTSGCDDPEENVSFKLDNDGCVTQDGIEVCINGTFTFGANNTFMTSFTFSALGFNETTTASGTYAQEGNTITICDDDGCESSSATISGGKLTITVPDAESNCTYRLVGQKQ